MPVLIVALDDNSLKFDSEPSFIQAELKFCSPPPRNSLKWRGSRSKPILKTSHFPFVLNNPCSTSSFIVTKQVDVEVTLVVGACPVEIRLRHRLSSLRILVYFESPQTNSGTVPRLRHHLSSKSLPVYSCTIIIPLDATVDVLSGEAKEGNIVLVCAMKACRGMEV
jgi:hypothetical protein